ncbi:MAG: hypothetical protein ACI9S8_000879 [Chlamydiales bacterium]|jgi:hypothetical protein
MKTTIYPPITSEISVGFFPNRDSHVLPALYECDMCAVGVSETGEIQAREHAASHEKGIRKTLERLVRENLPEIILSTFRYQLNHIVHEEREAWLCLELDALAARVNSLEYLEGGVGFDTEDPMYTFRQLMTFLNRKMEPVEFIAPQRNEMEMIGIFLRRLVQEVHLKDIYLKSNLHETEKRRMINIVDCIEKNATNTPELHFDLRCTRRGIYSLPTLRGGMDAELFKAADIMGDVSKVGVTAARGSADLESAGNAGVKTFLFFRGIIANIREAMKGKAYHEVLAIESYKRLALKYNKYGKVLLLQDKLEDIIAKTRQSSDWVVKYTGVTALYAIVDKVKQCHLDASDDLRKIILDGDTVPTKPSIFTCFCCMPKEDRIPSAIELIASYAKSSSGMGIKRLYGKEKWRVQDLAKRLVTSLSLHEEVAVSIRLRALEYARNFEGLKLCNADLHKADFFGANVKDGKFYKSYLFQANFRGANCQGTAFDDADIERADFRGAYGLDVEQIKKAENWELAFFDEEFKALLEAINDES